MNLATIHHAVGTTLMANPATVTKRRKAVEALKKSLAKKKDALLPMLKKRKAWFSTTQTDAKKSQFCARVQSLGIEVGEVRWSASGKSESPAFWFHPKEKFRKSTVFREGPWKWSRDSKDGKEIREFLKACEQHSSASAKNEREIQWQLAQALLNSNKPDAALRNLSPVTWNGCFTEIGVSVNLTGESGTGNIDLVVRRRSGWQVGFLVFELKTTGDTDVELALKQALRYATALNHEANEGDADNLKNYHAVLGSNGEKKLPIGAVVVLEDDKGGVVRRTAPAILNQYWSARGDSKIDRLGVLLYEFDSESKKAKSWKWLDGWDARKRPPVSQ